MKYKKKIKSKFTRCRLYVFSSGPRGPRGRFMYNTMLRMRDGVLLQVCYDWCPTGFREACALLNDRESNFLFRVHHFPVSIYNFIKL